MRDQSGDQWLLYSSDDTDPHPCLQAVDRQSRQIHGASIRDGLLSSDRSDILDIRRDSGQGFGDIINIVRRVDHGSSATYSIRALVLESQLENIWMSVYVCARESELGLCAGVDFE